ncbi:MAG: FAD-dependent oxidoreductase [Thermoleophilia bacterium]
MAHRSDRLRVVIAGGGIAAAEAALALRAYAADRVDIELVAPERKMPFRPASAIASFADVSAQHFDLVALAEDVGATFVQDRVEAVAGAARRVRLASGARRPYDVLVLALGARARAAIPGAVTFRDQRDAAQVANVVDDLRRGELGDLVVAVPFGATWTLPAYELALLAAAEVERLALRSEIVLVTPEQDALAAFGSAVSGAVAALLVDRGVRLVCFAPPAAVERDGLRLVDDTLLAADRVIALPVLAGQRISGLPQDAGGFVRTTPRGAVTGMPDVYAAGDMTAFPVKQGGLAAQQADAIAARIAARAGGAPLRRRADLVLRAQLFGAPTPLFLEARLDDSGRAIQGGVHEQAPWWPGATLFGRHISPWMAEQGLALAAEELRAARQT